MTIEKTLAERGARYGAFISHAEIAQGIQAVLQKMPNWDTLDYDMRQALVVISDKIARIGNGDPFYPDNWHDIAGYAKLVDDRLKLLEQKKKQAENQTVVSIAPGTITASTLTANSLEQLMRDISKNVLADIRPTGGLISKLDKTHRVGETPNHAEVATTKIKDLISSKSGS